MVIFTIGVWNEDLGQALLALKIEQKTFAIFLIQFINLSIYQNYSC